MASSGHASSHRPHSKQCPPSILYTSPSEITSTGQASRRKPQAVHLEVAQAAVVVQVVVVAALVAVVVQKIVAMMQIVVNVSAAVQVGPHL